MGLVRNKIGFKWGKISKYLKWVQSGPYFTQLQVQRKLDGELE